MVAAEFETLVKIAADDVTRLRRCDVYRVLDSVPTVELCRLRAWLAEKRPDLREEADDAASDILTERAAAFTTTNSTRR